MVAFIVGLICLIVGATAGAWLLSRWQGRRLPLEREVVALRREVSLREEREQLQQKLLILKKIELAKAELATVRDLRGPLLTEDSAGVAAAKTANNAHRREISSRLAGWRAELKAA